MNSLSIAEPYLQGSPAPVDIAFGPPGGHVAVRGGSRSQGDNADIWIAPIDSVDMLRPFVATPARDLALQISPDGTLLAFQSDQSGMMEVYATPIPNPGPRVQVSTGGGESPRWSPDGRELFYLSPSRLMAATIRTSPDLAVVRRDTLAAARPDPSVAHTPYDVLPNGEFLMVQRVTGAGGRIFAKVNRFEELRERMNGEGAR